MGLDYIAHSSRNDLLSEAMVGFLQSISSSEGLNSHGCQCFSVKLTNRSIEVVGSDTTYGLRRPDPGVHGEKR